MIHIHKYKKVGFFKEAKYCRCGKFKVDHSVLLLAQLHASLEGETLLDTWPVDARQFLEGMAK